MSFAAPSRILGRSISVAVIGIAAATAASLLPASTASAAGANTTAAALARAEQQANAIGIQADQAVEAFDEAQNALTAANVVQARSQAEVTKAQAQLTVARRGIQALAASEYTAGTSSRGIAVLLSASPATVLSEADLLSQVSRFDETNVAKVMNADRAVLNAQASAHQAVEAHRAVAAAVNAHKAAVQKILKAQQALVNRLQVQQQQEQASAVAAEDRVRESQLEASRSRSLAALTAQTDASQQADQGSPSNFSEPVSAPVAPPAASGSVSAVLAYAYAQLGKPYQWGGAGPSSFDCSGLAMRAWEAAGVSLGHSTVSQQDSGRRVSMSNLQPGDLVFWGSPAYHVGIYVGGGRVLDAPHTGTDVQIQSIWGNPSGAVRP